MNIKSLVPHEDDDEEEPEEEDEPEEPRQKKKERINDKDDDVNVSSLAISSTDSENNDQASLRHKKQNSARITFNFKDVEDTICPFEESDHYQVKMWILNFEDLAVLFKWNDMQKLVFSRETLKGAVKTFVHGLSVAQSWEKLKTALKEEFILKVNSADIYRKLAKKKLKQG